ncbi:tetratricopeptide repeat protein [Pulveribacter suum]|uniref:SAM-dependent methyltransferase n=1 Tax=Pulveribacter suum TaxID=2116657 RepID=A0A2P1NQ12_9BURK|nr:tetratricopeptide repeat protein [Pulveribacter suum]AVP59158.1 SAM-dependent methyltransferase [Pulveribacter suum]
MNASSDPNLGLIESARALIQQEQLDEAAALLNQAREQLPHDPRVYLMAGLMTEKGGNVEGAFQLMQRGLELAPNWPPAIMEVAQMQARQSQFPEALENAATALSLDAQNPALLEGAINVAQLSGQRQLAMGHLQQGLERDPANASWRRLLARNLSELKRYDEALAQWDMLLTQSPQDMEALEGRMHTLLAAGRLEDAAEVTAALLALDPGNAVYAYYDARAHGHTPAHQPAELNRNIFDSAAHVFDQQLVQGLRYHLPRQVAQKIRVLHPDKKLNLLDLGCGTGLLGQHLGKVQGRLAGVDISPKMLEQARRRGVYDSLELSDLHDTLRDTAEQSFDVITALDVCVYAGDLSGTVPAAARVLSPGGQLILSCETGPEEGPELVLNPDTGRYQHKRSHVEGLCRAAGFAVETEATILRYEKGQPVQGFVITARKAG